MAFSLTVPLTRIAVGGLSPLLIGAGRAVVAATLAVLCLGLTRQRLPHARQWLRLTLVGGGVVVGFPLLTSYALVTTPASHGAVVIAVLPAATAVATVIRTQERPPPAFWVAAGAGVVAALVFAAAHAGSGLAGLQRPDLLLFAAVVAAAVGYAEGGMLARELGAWQTVSWALVLCAPLMLALSALSIAHAAPTPTPREWAAFGYLAAVSMFLGFFAWYRGLALGPMSRVSQVQLVQPVLSIGWAAILLGEQLTPTTALAALAVIGCAASAVRVRAYR